MLLLASTSDKLQVVTSAAMATDVHASWVDVAAGATTPGRTNTAITTATTTDVVASPGSGAVRNVKALSVRNKDASSQTVTVRHTDGTTAVELYQATLLPGQSLQYVEGVGFVPPPPLIATDCGKLYYTNTTTLNFTPYRGGLLTINGIVSPITTGGVPGLNDPGVYVKGVAGQNLAANTLYYVYVFNNAGTLTADFSTTGHTFSFAAGNVGTEIKQSDETRSLIGMCRTGAGGIFVNSLTQIFVRSWFNETTVFGSKAKAADYTTASISFLELK
jgi:hypothetical protein